MSCEMWLGVLKRKHFALPASAVTLSETFRREFAGRTEETRVWRQLRGFVVTGSTSAPCLSEVHLQKGLIRRRLFRGEPTAGNQPPAYFRTTGGQLIAPLDSGLFCNLEIFLALLFADLLQRTLAMPGGAVCGCGYTSEGTRDHLSICVSWTAFVLRTSPLF